MNQEIFQTDADPSLKTIRRQTLKETVVLRIRQAIERGELKAGEQITELGLAKKLGVGQPTIREALLELEFVGFIERHGPRKTCVTFLTRRQIDEIYLVRVRLEILAAEILANSPAPHLQECEQWCREMHASAQAGDWVKFCYADLEFHRALWRSTENETLAGALERLVPKLFAFGIIQHARPTPEKLIDIAKQHRQLLDLIPKHDVEGTGNLMELSMAKAWMDDMELPDIS